MNKATVADGEEKRSKDGEIVGGAKAGLHVCNKI